MPRMVWTLLIVLALGHATPVEAVESSVDNAAARAQLRTSFEERYQAWVAWTEEHDQASSMAGVNEALYDLIELGPETVPLLVDAMARGEHTFDVALAFAVSQLTKRYSQREDFPEGTLGDAHTAAKLCVTWWREGRGEAETRFAQYCEEMKEARAAGDLPKVAWAMKRIWRLGLDALPLIVEQIRQGDEVLVPLVPRLTAGADKMSDGKRVPLPEWSTREECLAWYEEHGEAFRLPPSEPGQEGEVSGRAEGAVE